MPEGPIPIEEIRAARQRIEQIPGILRTPLIRLNMDDAPAKIYLKLENLQPIGSFKLRGSANAIALASQEQLSQGVYTASAGNMAQGVAWNARRLGLKRATIVPDHAPQAKLEAIQRLGADIVKVTFDQWWDIIIGKPYESMDGFFVHPVSDPAVIAGNGTIGLEILEDLPDVDSVLIPYGGGGLSSGIASALRALKPDTRIYAAEVETGAPLAPSLAAGKPLEVDYTPSFVDGAGGKGILPAMWPIVSQLLNGSIVVSLNEIADALRLLMQRNNVIVEGAGALPVAAALTGKAGSGKVVCVVSGGNIDPDKLAKILNGQTP